MLNRKLARQTACIKSIKHDAGSVSTGNDYSEEPDASEHSESVSKTDIAGCAWQYALGEHGSFGMADLRAKAEALRATAQMAQLRASANRTGKQCVTPLPAACMCGVLMVRSLMT